MREGTQHVIALSLKGLPGPTTDHDGIVSFFLFFLNWFIVLAI